MPKGSFYYYFPSKEAFGQAVIAQFAAAYLARLEQYLRDTTASPLTACVATTKTCSPGLSAVGAGGCLIGNLSQELADHNPRLQAQLDAVLTSWRERYAQLFREAKPWANCGRTAIHRRSPTFISTVLRGRSRAKVSKSPAPLRLFLTCMFDGVLQAAQQGRECFFLRPN